MQIEKLVLEPLDNNCYVLKNNGYALVIDPSSEEDVIEKCLKELDVELVGILITHYHYDHIGALDYFVNKYDIPVFDYRSLGL